MMPLRVIAWDFPRVQLREVSLMNIKSGNCELNLDDNKIIRAWLKRTLLKRMAFLFVKCLAIIHHRPLYICSNIKTQRQIVPAIDLKGALHIEVEGLSRSVTLCSSESGTDSLEQLRVFPRKTSSLRIRWRSCMPMAHSLC